MEVFRISEAAYAKRLTASGRPNRWNLEGQFVLYSAASRSLSTLELIVHRGSIVPLTKNKLIVLSLPDDDHFYKQLKLSDLPADWRKMTAYSQLQRLGSQWYSAHESLILKVPSAVIPKEYNYIINMEHPEFSSNVTVVRLEDYFWDERLF